MRTLTIMMLVVLLINLSGCSNLAGNVVPQKGPSMENVYDSMRSNSNKISLKPIHKFATTNVKVYSTQDHFKKIPNPELNIYVYPHLAGKDQVPIPGYYTVFNAYTQDHYALPNE